MNRHENNKMNMFQSADAVFNRYQDVIKEIDPLAAAVQRYKGALTVIRQRNSEHNNAATGVTAAKRTAADNLIDKTTVCAKVLFSFGKKSGNEPLVGHSHISRSALGNMRYNELVDRSNLILELARTHAEGIAPLGYDAKEIDDLKNSIDLFAAQSAEQVQKMAESKAAREELYKAFNATDTILREELDILIELVKTKQPEFYNHYQAIRIIKDIGGHSSRNGKTEPEKSEEETEAVELTAEPVAV